MSSPGTECNRRPMCVARLAAAFVLLALTASAQVAGDDLTELSLEDLMDIEVTVTSVSKKSQGLQETPAAVYVITAEDIRRSGANSIPEALRLAPGVYVARLNENTWNVSTRGFSNQFVNNLLVMIDGRTVYTTLFSGVFWDVQDVMLEDIERIEVIRGPGASVWGANAVNGVINIITKAAKDTQGTLLSVQAGTEDRPTVALRHGGEIGENGHYRVYAKDLDRDGLGVDGGGSDDDDDRRQHRAGFRMDFSEGDGTFSLHGDVYNGVTDFPATFPVLTPFPGPTEFNTLDDQRVSGANLVAHWSRETGPDASWDLSLILDHTKRDSVLLEDRRDTVEADFSRRQRLDDTHDLVWGFGWRGTHALTDGTDTVSFDDDDRFDQIFSAFVQDEITLSPDLFALTLGTKVEHNDYTGVEVQPTARFSFTPSSDTTIWGAWSHAVRTPSQVEEDGTILFSTLAGVPPGFNNGLLLMGDDDFDSEQVDSLELGFRKQFNDRLSVDVAAFSNSYDHMQTLEMGLGAPVGPGAIVTPVTFANMLDVETRGVEVAVAWKPTDSVDLRSAFSRLKMDYDLDGGSTNLNGESGEEGEPENIFNLTAHWDLAERWELDGGLFRVSDLPATSIDGYWRADMRLGYRPDDQSEVSVGFQNLFHDDEYEFAPSFLGGQAEMESMVYLRYVRRW